MWIFVQRLSLFLFTAFTGDQLIRGLFSRDIKPNKIYNSDEVASLLRIEKGVVIELIKRGDIKARKVNGKNMILGQNITEFLSE